jgi:radical SAM superfamily enzyme YgiQ (UPF0313 family)
MRVLLISANTEKINMPTLPMGLGSVATALGAAGHTVRFLDLMGTGDWQSLLGKTLDEAAPEVIGISIRNIDDQVSTSPRFLLAPARAVVTFCRAHVRVPIVLGGAGYSIFPQAVLDYTGADMGIQGDGEAAAVMLLERLESSSPPVDVPGLVVRGKGIQAPPHGIRDLDRLAHPGPQLFDPRFARDPDYFLPIQTRRGCPLNCSYCSTSTIEGRLIRKRSPAAVVDTLRRWRSAGYSRVFFVDNVFNLPVRYAEDLCRHLAAARLDLRWRAILYPGRVTAALVRSMARAGCRDISLGFESGSSQILNRMHKRFSPDDIRLASRLLAEAGIGRMGFLLLGGPGETRHTVLESLAFADRLKLNALKVTIGLRIYPYTELARIAVSEGVIEPRDDLLRPTFYIARGLDAWLRETVSEWVAQRPHWMM